MPRSDRALNKTERLFALVLLLQNRPHYSSRDLAVHFGVSRRTIFRDLRTLAESGVPLTYADDGGGYEILEGYQLPPLMLTAREAATLLVGAEFTKLQPDASLRADADAVSLKIRSVLPESLRAYMDRLRAQTVIAPFTPEMPAASAADDEEGRWYDLSQALARQQTVFMRYWVESREELTARKVDPLGLVYYSDHWNLIARDHLRGEVRNFRLDQIVKMDVTEEPFEVPAGFDLKEHLRERGESPSNVRVVVVFAERAWRWARRALPAEVEVEEDLGDEGTRATFYFENLDYVARWLLRYGTDAEIEEPEALKAKVRERALALAARYESVEA